MKEYFLYHLVRTGRGALEHELRREAPHTREKQQADVQRQVASTPSPHAARQ
jgi:hypothetical protein